MEDDRRALYCPLLHGTCAEGFVKGKMAEEKRTGLREKCRFWIGLSGKNPQSGKEFNNYDCALAWGPTLSVEQSRIQNGTAAAIESLRNRVAETKGVLTNMRDQKALEGPDAPRIIEGQEAVPELSAPPEPSTRLMKESEDKPKDK